MKPTTSHSSPFKYTNPMSCHKPKYETHPTFTQRWIEILRKIMWPIHPTNPLINIASDGPHKLNHVWWINSQSACVVPENFPMMFHTPLLSNHHTELQTFGYRHVSLDYGVLSNQNAWIIPSTVGMPPQWAQKNDWSVWHSPLDWTRSPSHGDLNLKILVE